ncbi:MAG TPA: tetratricopeptide repeat protein [Bryobacteraceae bacterium]|nr:tetratricopeptide repeat protein [Bryobacteraceae bacterium]
MPDFYLRTLRSFCFLGVALTAASAMPAVQEAALGQTPPEGAKGARASLPATAKESNTPKAAAYYHYALGHLYEEMAGAGGANGNHAEYINDAIDNYKLALQEDPNASFLVEDIAELYRLSGRLREAVQQAQEALKNNPDDLNAHRVLAHIYTQQIGDSQTNHIDEAMIKRAIEQYKFVTDKDPKDAESLVMMGRLDKLLENSVDAESAFKRAMEADPDNEDAITGLASVYTDRGDPKAASALLEKAAKSNPSPRSLVVLANNYEQLHEYSLAADTYKKALALDPSRMELKAALAQDQALAGQLDDAIATYKELAKANPEDAQPYLGLSQIYRDQKKFDLARQANDKAKALDPQNLEVRYNDVLILQDEGKQAEAITTLKGILDASSRRTYNPNQVQARARMLEQLGLLYRNGQQYDQAAGAFRQIADLDPNLASRAEAQIIDTYRLGKQFAKAQQESDTANKKYPGDRTIHEVTAELLADEGKYDAAIAQLKGLLNGKDDREIYIAMAEIYEKGKNFPEMAKAIDAADKLSHSKDERTTVLFLRGTMYERQKKFEPAESAFREVLSLDPNNTSALNYLGYMLADQNTKLSEAQDLLKRAVNLEPNNGAFLDSLGWVYYRQNRLTEAEDELKRALQTMSTDPTVHDHLGDVYSKEGKLKEAIDQWQASLKNWNSSAPGDMEPDQIAKVQKKLDSARVRLARMRKPTAEN